MSRSRIGSRAACGAALLLASGAASGQVLQTDDVLLVRYACDGGTTNSVVEAYRPSTAARVFTTPGGTQGCWEGVVSLPSGGFAVGRKIPSGVNLFDPSGAMTSTFATPEVAYASDVAVFSDGSMAVVDLLTNDVERYSPNGQHLGNHAHPSLLSPWGAHVDDDDILWVADRVSSSSSTGAAVRFDQGGAWLGTITFPVQCDDLVVAPDGTMWTVGRSNGTAYHFHADGTLLSSFPALSASAADGIAMLSDGSLVFASSGLPDLYRYDQGGVLLGKIPIAPGGPQAFRLAAVVDVQWQSVGDGLAGASGVPALDGLGTLQAGSATQLTLTNAAPGASSVLILGAQRIDAPLLGGTLVPSADILLQPIPVGPVGSWTLGGVWPAGVPAGAKVWFQAWIPDVVSPQGYAASNGLEATAP
ncbi:MAG: hypothetical protein ACF8XB_11540 [Planctomycetota bacterium JB042]